MDYLWTPWRYAYVSANEKSSGCVFCDLVKENNDEKALIVYRGLQCFVVLNRYPYTSGHVMIVPYAHLDELRWLGTVLSATGVGWCLVGHSAELTQRAPSLGTRLGRITRWPVTGMACTDSGASPGSTPAGRGGLPNRPYT